MRILFATQAEKTHLLSMVPLAWALRAAGHEVRVASQPELRPAVTESGLPFCPVGPGYRLHNYIRAYETLDARVQRDDDASLSGVADGALPWPQVRDLYQGAVWFWLRAVNEPILGDLVALCRSWRPHLVVWEPATYAAGVAAAASGTAHVRFLWGMDIFAHLREEFRRHGSERTDPLAAWLAACAERVGAPYSEELMYGRATIDPYPQEVGLAGPRPRLPMRFVAYNGRARIPRWLREPPSRPRVCVTLGTTSPERFGGAGLDGFLAAMAGLDVELVVALSAWQRDGIGARHEANVRIVDFVPLHPLLAGCSAVVHHGGASTCLTALALGVPQLLLSGVVVAKYQFDEGVLARRLAAQGAGLELDAAATTPEAVGRGLRRLLTDPDFTAQARRLQGEVLAAPSPADLAARLMPLVA